MPDIPKAWLSKTPMRRIICHWTAGGYHPSENDRAHYHILIDGDGKLHRGTHAIAANESTGDGDYAAHTRGANTRSIGISMCCMAGAREMPFAPGSAPMTRAQWDAMVDVAAQLCRAYGIAVSPATVLGHGEVQKNIGAPQKGKWDPMKLPFAASLTKTQVGAKLREEVSARLKPGHAASPNHG
jgi:N-acetyl-anhydromuramyl-L-alanine amidase AmpD